MILTCFCFCPLLFVPTIPYNLCYYLAHWSELPSLLLLSTGRSLMALTCYFLGHEVLCPMYLQGCGSHDVLRSQPERVQPGGQCACQLPAVQHGGNARLRGGLVPLGQTGQEAIALRRHDIGRGSLPRQHLLCQLRGNGSGCLAVASSVVLLLFQAISFVFCSVSLCVCVCLSVCLSVCLCLSLSLSLMSVCVCMCVCACVCVNACVRVRVWRGEGVR